MVCCLSTYGAVSAFYEVIEVKIYESMERIYLRTIQGKNRGVGSWLLNLALHPLSFVYRTAVFARNKAFDCGFLKSYKPDIPAIISIGNITAGGTGKTPITLLLAKTLVEKVPLAILSRGYRSHAENLESPLRLCNGHGPEYPVNLCGDEPYLLAQNVPKASIFVGKNRKLAADMAAKQGAKLLILDDGMQHRQISRNFEVIILDANNPFDGGRLLPRGLLREEISSLKRAHLVILNHVEEKETYTSLSTEIARYTSAPIVGTIVSPTSLHTLDGTQIESLKGIKVGMFCAIGAPQNFERTLTKCGAQIIGQLLLLDHKRADKKTLFRFAEECLAQGAAYIVCTEKDKVKLMEEKLDLPLPIIWVKITLEVKEGASHWKDFVKKTLICAKNGGKNSK